MATNKLPPIVVPEPITPIPPLDLPALDPAYLATYITDHLTDYPAHLQTLWSVKRGYFNPPGAQGIANWPQGANTSLIDRAYKVRSAVQYHRIVAAIRAALKLPNGEDLGAEAEAREMYESLRALSIQCAQSQERHIAAAHEAIAQRKRDAITKAQATRKANEEAAAERRAARKATRKAKEEAAREEMERQLHDTYPA